MSITDNPRIVLRMTPHAMTKDNFATILDLALKNRVR